MRKSKGLVIIGFIFIGLFLIIQVNDFIKTISTNKIGLSWFGWFFFALNSISLADIILSPSIWLATILFFVAHQMTKNL